MVVLRTTTTTRTKRAASVPVGHYGDTADSGFLDADIDSQNAAARRISTAAKDDADALRLASRRHDEQLLRDINARLTSASMNAQPSANIKRSSYTINNLKKPPLPPTRPALFTTRYSSAATQPTLRTPYIDDDSEFDYVIPTPVTKSVIRSARSTSVPPQVAINMTPRTAVTPPPSARGHRFPWSSKSVDYPWSVDGFVQPRSAPPVNYEPRFVYEYQPKERVDNSPHYTHYNPPHLTPVADLAIRQAHRNLDRINSELKNNKHTEPIPYVPYTYAARTFADLEPERTPVVTRRTVYSSSPYVRHTSLSPARARVDLGNYRRYVPSPSPVRSTVDVTFLPGPPLHNDTLIKASTIGKLGMEVESQLFPTEMYRTRATPPLSSVKTTTTTYRSLPTSIPRYDVNSDITLHTVRSTPPLVTSSSRYDYKQPIEFAPIPQASSARPKISETRRKVRDVLCKVKKDPHYFD